MRSVDCKVHLLNGYDHCYWLRILCEWNTIQMYLVLLSYWICILKRRKQKYRDYQNRPCCWRVKSLTSTSKLLIRSTHLMLEILAAVKWTNQNEKKKLHVENYRHGIKLLFKTMSRRHNAQQHTDYFGAILLVFWLCVCALRSVITYALPFTEHECAYKIRDSSNHFKIILNSSEFLLKRILTTQFSSAELNTEKKQYN